MRLGCLWRKVTYQKKKKRCQLSTRKSANKTTEYQNVFLMMRAHWSKLVLHALQMCTANYQWQHPTPAQKWTFSLSQCSPASLLHWKNMPSKVNLNILVLSTSYDAELSVWMWKAKITNLTDMSVNLENKFMADTQLLTKGAERTSKYYILIITKNYVKTHTHMYVCM